MKRASVFVVLILFVVLLSSCNDGSSRSGSESTEDNENIQTEVSKDVGVFLDSRVEGLQYSTTSGLEGLTNEQGEFEYREGDFIHFGVGNIYLGQTEAQPVLTTFDLEHPEKVAQLLQTFDDDAFPENGIKITPELSERALEYYFKVEDLDQDSSFCNQMALSLTVDNDAGPSGIVPEYFAVKHAVVAESRERLKTFWVSSVDSSSSSDQATVGATDNRFKTFVSNENAAVSTQASLTDSDNTTDIIRLFASYVFGNQQILVMNEDLFSDVRARVNLFIYHHIHRQMVLAESGLYWDEYQGVTHSRDTIHDHLEMVGKAVTIFALAKSGYDMLPGNNPNLFEMLNAASGAMLTANKEYATYLLENSNHPVVNRFVDAGHDMIASIFDQVLTHTQNSTMALVDIALKSADITNDVVAAAKISKIVETWNSHLLAEELIRRKYELGETIIWGRDEIDAIAQQFLPDPISVLDQFIPDVIANFPPDMIYDFQKVFDFYHQADLSITKIYNSLDEQYDFSDDRGYFGGAANAEYALSMLDVNIKTNKVLVKEQTNNLTIPYVVKNNSYINLDEVFATVRSSSNPNKSYAGWTEVALTGRYNGAETNCSIDIEVSPQDLLENESVDSFYFPMLLSLNYSVNYQTETLEKEFSLPIVNEEVIDPDTFTCTDDLFFDTTYSTDYPQSNIVRLYAGAVENPSCGEYLYQFTKLSGPDIEIIKDDGSSVFEFKVPEVGVDKDRLSFTFVIDAQLTKDNLPRTTSSTYSFVLKNDNHYALDFISETLRDGTFVTAGQTYTKTWTVKNTSSQDLHDVILDSIQEDTKLTDTGISPVSIPVWKQNEEIEFETQIIVPDGIDNETHFKKWRFLVDGKSIGYESGTSTAYISYELNFQTLDVVIPTLDGGVNIVTTDKGFDLNWQEATGEVSYYELYRSTTADTLGGQIYAGGSLSYSDVGLSNGKTYYYTAMACNDHGCGSSEQSYATFKKAADDAPPTLIINTAGSGSVQTENFLLNITATDDNGLSVVGCGIYTNSGENTGIAAGSQENAKLITKDYLIDISTLNPGSYVVKALAQDNANQKSIPQYYNFTIPAPEEESPPSLQGLITFSLQGDTLVIHWPEATGEVDTYHLYRSETSGTIGSLVSLGTDLSHTDDNVVNGTTYYYSVQACNDGGCSEKLTRTVTCAIDVPPTVTINTPGSGNERTENFSLSITATDDVGLSTIGGVILTSSGTSTGVTFGSALSSKSVTISYTVNISTLALGDYKIVVRANDTKGQNSSDKFYRFTKVGPVIPSTTWYVDSDGDGYGDPNVTTIAVEQPAGYVANSSDCNDGNADQHPGHAEIADGIDNDCDGNIDEGFVTWYADLDGDLYSSGITQVTNIQPVGYRLAGDLTAVSGDADDNDNTIFPGAPELCDGKDNDQDMLVDEGDVCGVPVTWYADTDGDGFGDPNVTVSQEDQPVGFVLNGNDCNDADELIHPGAVEVPSDGIDQDCNGVDALELNAAKRIFNFDFRSLGGIPYTSIRFIATFDYSDPITVGSDVFQIYVYGDVDGQNLLQIRNESEFAIYDDGTRYGPTQTSNSLFEPMYDGVFSYGLKMSSGTALLTSLKVCGVTPDGLICIDHSLIPD